MYHSFQLKGWAETQLPIVFRKCYFSLRYSYPNFQENDHLIFPQNLLLRMLPSQSLSPKLLLNCTNTESFPLLYMVYFAPITAIFLGAGTLILCFIHLLICSLNPASAAWQILNKMNKFKLHLDSNHKNSYIKKISR